MKLRELLRQTERRLAAARLHYGHGTGNPRDEAAYLVLRGLGLTFECDPEIEITQLQRNRVHRLLRKRLRDRIPVAYLLNEAWLGGLPFYVDRRVIVPRSHLAELLQLRLRPWLRRPPRRILDLCTGSGCLAVLAAKAFSGAAVDATDVSAAALAVAAINVKKFKLTQRIRLVRSELFSALQNQRYDLIVSNPPYVTTPSLRRLPPEYRYEPGIALAGGRDGLELVSRILEGAPEYLNPGGVLACEVGANQRSVERAYPLAPLVWPKDEVFIFPASRTAAVSRAPPTRPRGR